jgi:regulator of protease activity HflC (stomatin/prohibitin superfamily)
MPLLYLLIFIFVLLIFVVRPIIINEYERGVVYFLGRYNGILTPGFHLIIPLLQNVKKVDMRTKAVDIPKQEAISRDNVSYKMNAVIYYKVDDAAKTINEVESVYWAVSQLAQTTMRRIAGEVTLDELLSNREKIAQEILKAIDPSTEEWGINVSSVELKDIELPESMVRTMAKQAEAEREKRATVINSEGEVQASQNLAHAAKVLAANPGALHLRTLNSINDISSDASNTVVFMVPMELLKAVDGFASMLAKKK